MSVMQTVAVHPGAATFFFVLGRAGPPGRPRITNDIVPDSRTACPAVTPYLG